VPVYSLAFADTQKDGQAELTQVAGYIPRWFTRPQMVICPSTNLAGRRVTSLIETNALPLSQTATFSQTATMWIMVTINIRLCLTFWYIKRHKLNDFAVMITSY